MLSEKSSYFSTGTGAFFGSGGGGGAVLNILAQLFFTPSGMMLETVEDSGSAARVTVGGASQESSPAGLGSATSGCTASQALVSSAVAVADAVSLVLEPFV